MAIASRLTNTGTLLVNGSFDEVSYSANGGTGQIGVNGVNTTTNKFTYTQDFSNAIWVKQQLSTSVDVTADTIAAPDGSLTADKLAQSATGGTYYAVYQTVTPIASTNYAYSMFVKNAGGTGSINLTIYDSGNAQAQYAQFNITTGVAGATTITGVTFTLNSSSITSYGNSWYRCAFNFSSSTSSSFQFKVDIGVSGVGTGVYLWGAQLEQSLTPTAYVGMLGTGVNLNNFAQRINPSGIEYASGSFDEVSYNPNGGTGQIGVNGINTTTNLLINSQNFEITTVAGWFGATPVTNAAYITPNATTSPTGDNTGQKLYSAPAVVGSTIQRVYRNVSFTSGLSYTFSVYVKAAEFSQFWSFIEPASTRYGIAVNLSTQSVSIYSGTPTDLFLTSVGNGWYRTGFTWVAPATESVPVDVMRLINNSGLATFIGDGVSGVYVWGAQVEQAAAATTYVATGATTSINLNNFARRNSNTGIEYAAEAFDEVTWNPPIVTSGLVLNLDAAVPGSYLGTGTTWTDLSGSSNNGTLVNAPTFSNLNYGQFQFDYTLSQWCSFASAGSLQFLNLSPYTLEAWIYPTVDAGAANYTGIFNRESSAMGTRDGYNFIIVQTGGTGQLLFVERFVGGVSITVGETISTASFLNTWNHVVATFDGSVLKLYRNGVLKQTSASTTANLTNNVQTLEVARRGVQYFRGNMPVARIYNTALSLTDIKQNYNALCYRYGLATI